MAIAKVFRSGNSQAVRIPKEFRLPHGEVEIERRGDALVLRPRRVNWEEWLATLERLGSGFMSEGRKQPPPQRRRKLL